VFNLETGVLEFEAPPMPIHKEERLEKQALKTDGGYLVRKKDTGNDASRTKLLPRNKKAAAVYARLVEAGDRVHRLIENSAGGANKDVARLAEELNHICERFE
jgi:hypothetical protein